MNRWTVVPLLLTASLLLSGSADAGTPALDFGKVLKILGGSITVPQEWDGIWDVEDSTYTCADSLLATSVSADTICGGEAYGVEDPGPWTFSCTGTADATTVDATCTGGGELFPDCQVAISFVHHATRTGDSYKSVQTMNVIYTGTGLGCDFFTDSCQRTVSYGTRTGPSNCTTPAKRTSWGRLKQIYR